MIENPTPGMDVVYILENMCLDTGIIDSISDDGFIWLRIKWGRGEKCFSADEVFSLDDHDGITAGLKRLIENARATMQIVAGKKKARKPVLKPSPGPIHG